MRVQSESMERSKWYASLTNYVGSWNLIGHLDEDRNEGTDAPTGPGCSKTAGGLVALDIHGFVRAVCSLEKRREEETVTRRFRHYLDDKMKAYDINEQDREELAKEMFSRRN